MGIERQVVFPSFAGIAIHLYANPNAVKHLDIDADPDDARALGRAGIRAHNEWITEATEGAIGDHLSGVAVLTGETVDELIEDAER